jgi:FkbM family methyltransferase
MATVKINRWSHWWRELRTYWHESKRIRDFIRVMRVRLSQSKVGPWVTPHPIVVAVDLRSLGDGIRLRSHTTDISVLAELVLGQSIGSLPAAPKAETVIDLGANTGLAYRWLRRRYPSARFVCVEPEPGNLKVLRANVASSDGSCKVIGACIGARERRVKLLAGDGEWGFRMADVDDPAAGDIYVTTMDRILAETGMVDIDVLKCDVEGAEAELFANCRSWIGRVRAMVVECHLDVTSTAALMEMLARNGAEFELVHMEHDPVYRSELATLQRRGVPALPAAA